MRGAEICNWPVFSEIRGGEAIKRLGTRSRQDIEKFLDAKVFLDLHVKVNDNWRDDERMLKRFGY